MKSCFADDIFTFDQDNQIIKQTYNINENLKIIHNWAYKWCIVFDSAKFKLINLIYSDHVVNKNPCIYKLMGQWCSKIMNELFGLYKQKLLYMKIQLQSSECNVNVLIRDVCRIDIFSNMQDDIS